MVDEGPDLPDPLDEPWSLWVERPARSRSDAVSHGRRYRDVVDGRRRWWWTEEDGDHVEEDHDRGLDFGPAEPLLVPYALLADFALQIEGRTTVAGRDAITIRARPAPSSEDAVHRGLSLGAGADEYVVAIDAERGALLRVEARLGGEPFSILEVNEVAFDGPIDPDVFAISPTDPLEPEAPWQHDLTLSQLAEAVPSTLLVPERLPDGWIVEVHAMLEPASGRGGRPLQASITYMYPDDRMVGLQESAEPLPPIAGQERRVEDGLEIHEETRVRPPVRTAWTELLGTHVQLWASGVEMDEVIRMARSLVPLPTEPPELVPGDG